MKKFLAVLLACLIPVALAGCGDEGGSEEEISCDNLPPGKLMQKCIDKRADKADRMDAQNDPRLFGVNLAVIATSLPRTGTVAKMAWPADYWPTFKDSANNRWQGQGTYSPLEKYDLAFNDWTPPNGFDQLVPFQSCGQQFDADYYDKLGPAAKFWSNNKGNKARRDRWDSAGCEDAIETWWGLCHAWVPAAILEPEPQKAVTYNNVTFEVSDVKALFMMMYDRSTTKFLGRRCNLRNDQIERDENGRIIQDECRDTNPGSMHLILTNLLGRDKRAFAEDRTMSYQVWNQPVIGYEVEVQEEISMEVALQLLDPGGTVCTQGTYCYNEDAKKFYEVLIDVDYITESPPSKDPMIPHVDQFTRTDTYHYVLECEDDGEIIGGEWISAQVTAFPDRITWPPDSQTNHTDFLWLPLSAGFSSNPHASLERVRMLARMSTGEDPPPWAKVFKSDQVVNIPDNVRTGAVSAIEVTEAVDIGTMKVTVDITHTYAGDLTISLRHDGREVVLQRNAGGSTEDIRKTFDVEGFFSGSTQGTWELVVVDGAENDVGTINSWKLTVIGSVGSSAETFTMDTPTSIPDGDTNGVTSNINVAGGGAVKSLKVIVDISHTWISDLRVELRHGTGTAFLHNREGDDSDDIKKTYSIDNFNSVDSGGDWYLVVVDNAKEDEGVINSWALQIER